MDWGSVVGLVAQVAGQAAGSAMSQMDKDKAMALIQQSTDQFGKIQIPQLQKLLLSQQGNTNLANIKDDPTYRDQQNAADAQLGDIIDSGGLTLADKANLNALRNRTARTESAGRNAITQGMAARGTLDSGAQLAAQLQGNQQSANTLAAGDEAAAGQAQARAFQAIKERAALAGQGLDRSYNQKSNAARAQDAINAGNTAILNTAAKFNAGIPQQNFRNELDLAGAQSGARADMASVLTGRANDTQNRMTALGNTFSSAFKGQGGGSSSKTGNTGPGADYSGSDLNTPAYPESTDSNDYAGKGSPSDLSSNESALTSESTRPGTDGRQIIGYDANGKPIYGQPQGQNY